MDIDKHSNTLNVKNVLVRSCLYVLSIVQATLEAQFIKKLSSSEAGSKKDVAYKKSGKVLMNYQIKNLLDSKQLKFSKVNLCISSNINEVLTQ